MVRETKAVREAREAAEREAELAKELAEYPARVIAALERATDHNLKITVENGKFVVAVSTTYTNDYGRVCTDIEEAVIYPVATKESGMYGLEDLLRVLNKLDVERAERERKLALRASAINKLTPEELDVLLGV